MNASVFLHHFCDLHGPTILLCTETRYIHDTDDDDLLDTFYSQYTKAENLITKPECKSCTLSLDSILVSSIDPDCHLLFISAPNPNNQELYKNGRNACLRSLNCERAADIDQGVLFGDDENGYCLSFTFSIKDFHARGNQHLYSLCYLTSDKYYIISILPIITEYMKQIAKWMQNDATLTYEKEARIKGVDQMTPSTLSSEKYGHVITTLPAYVYRVLPHVPKNRALSEITHDQHITYRIHSLFVWLLRSTNRAIQENLFDAIPTEEETTKMERKEVLDDSSDPVSSSSPTAITRRRLTLVNFIPSSQIGNSILAVNDLTVDLYSDNNSQEYDFSTCANDALRLFQQFMEKINQIKHVHYILYHLCIGNQIIIKYSSKMKTKETIRQFLCLLRLLLPDGCCRLVESSAYVLSCSANILVLDSDTSPSCDSDIPLNNNNNSTDSLVILKITIDNDDKNIQEVKMETPVVQDFIVPSYIKTVIDLLSDTTMETEAFESVVVYHKMKYLNKSKLLFQLGRLRSKQNLSDKQLLDILNLKNSSDLEMVRFWQRGLSLAYRTRIRTLISDYQYFQQQQNSR
ncbi:unnamed protein product [Didymodactylos carnosus]|uniref:Folliculin n=1 Tax=Didymodactylos carnosus TaxID=1234261 RepID=A0A813RMI5_9BILA|nr:unnamed protein product [Didymodactylos carnosus]CAF0901218.1 unnamed protein product [Didymodactylos carnosus]CAF3565892.1 unnamed protein product [Didymodactylos carnosus]CAF3681881.1 unnamed protein product [Didymodactylos carnosus]